MDAAADEIPAQYPYAVYEGAAAHLPIEDHARRNSAADLAANPGSGYDPALLPARCPSGRVGWSDSHLHNFEKDGKYWGVPQYDDLIDESNVRLAQVLKAKDDSLIYVYDFGDNWRHEIVLEQMILANEPMKAPTCLGGERRCPPEDVGGVSGYENFLEIISDPRHEDYEEYVGWAGGRVLDEFHLEAVNEVLSRMRWPVRHRR